MPVSFPLLELAGPPTDGVSEVQRLTKGGTVSGGTFDITYGGQTATIPWNATHAQAEALLTTLSSIGVGNLTVSGGPFPGTPLDLNFGGSLGGLNLSAVTKDVTNLTGAGADVTVSTPTSGVKGIYRGAQGGCLLADTANGDIYINTGTHYVPVWTAFDPSVA
jgi:hypothetical protein